MAEADDDFLGCRTDGEADAGVRTAKHHGQAIAIRPLAKFLRADVGLILMVRDHKLDLVAEHRSAEIRNRHLDGFNTAFANDVGIKSRHIVDVADHHLVGGCLGKRCNKKHCSGKRTRRRIHDSLH